MPSFFLFVVPDLGQAEALQREVCRRSSYWQQQRQKEEEMLGDLDSSLMHCVCTVTNSEQVNPFRPALTIVFML